jgi:hypothetical protein
MYGLYAMIAMYDLYANEFVEYPVQSCTVLDCMKRDT